MLLYVFDKGQAFLLHHSAFQAESSFSLHCYTKQTTTLMVKLVCVRASTVLHANSGVICARGQPCIQSPIGAKASDMFMEKNTVVIVYFQQHVPTGKTPLHSLQQPLKG